MINWMLEVEDAEDVACAVDDMEATDRLQSLVQRGRSEGRGCKRAQGPKKMEGRCPRCRRCLAVETPTRSVIRVY